MDENQVVKDLILNIFKLIDEREEYRGINKYRIHKILYKLKKELPDEHPLKDKIPYYWYLHGPYSEIVENEITELSPFISEKDGLLYMNEIKNMDFNNELIDNKANNILKRLFKPDIFFKIREDVYYDYAHYEFLPLFKIELIDSTYQYLNDLRQDKHDEDKLDYLIDLI